jgi:endonuclease YncB( thermonuclease family)
MVDRLAAQPTDPPPPATDPPPPADAAEVADALPTIPLPDFTGLPAQAVVRVPSASVILVRMGEQSVPVRLLGVEPEAVGAPTATADNRQAMQFLRNLLLGERVYIVSDVGEAGSPTTSYIYRVPDGLFVNAELVRQGYSRVHTQPRFQHREAFLRFEEHASRYNKGLWGRAARQAATDAAAERLKAAQDKQAQPTPPPDQKPDAPQVRTAPPRRRGAPIKLIGDKQSFIYHDTICRLCPRIVFPETIDSPRDAQLKGYRPCRICKPPR